MTNYLLIVEDDQDFQEYLLDIVNDSNIPFKIVKNGKLALDLMHSAEGRDIVCIVTDLNMPEVDGLTMLQNLRGTGYDLPVIILTAYGNKEKAIEAIRLGAYDFQDKPCQTERLISSIKTAYEIGQQLKNLDAEVEARLAGQDLSEDEKTQYRESLKNLLLLKKEREIRFKKAL